MTVAPSVPRRLRPDEYPPPGTRVRLNVRTLSGWMGKGTMLMRGLAIKDGYTDHRGGAVEGAPHEWVVLQDQTPNPEHAEALRAYGVTI
jgi:hypothetical protein